MQQLLVTVLAVLTATGNDVIAWQNNFASSFFGFGNYAPYVTASYPTQYASYPTQYASYPTQYGQHGSYQQRDNPEFLSCQSGNNNSLQVSLTENSGYGSSKYGSPYSAFGFQGGYGDFQYGIKGGDVHGGGGVSAEIALNASAGLAGRLLNVIVVDRGFIPAGGACLADNFGKGLSLSKSDSHGHGYASPQQLYGGKGGTDTRQGNSGILTTATVPATGGTVTLTVGKINGFKSLAQLAGRAIIVCTDVMITSDGRAMCPTGTGAILSCCILSYDDTDRVN